MINVFISHSGKDKELVMAIDFNFRSIDVNPLFMEFTPESEPPYEKIEERLKVSNAVFLFLTQNVKSSVYTQNWISFEVGLAKKSNKQLFVLEDFTNKVHFPVPYLTDYILYEPTKIEDWQQIQRILQNIKQIIENNKLIFGLTGLGALDGALSDKSNRLRGFLTGGFKGLVLGGILSALNPPTQTQFIRTTCPKCKIEFNFYSKFRQFPCPTCRMELELL